MNPILAVVGWFIIVCLIGLLVKDTTVIVYFFKQLHIDNQQIIRNQQEIIELLKEEENENIMSN